MLGESRSNLSTRSASERVTSTVRVDVLMAVASRDDVSTFWCKSALKLCITSESVAVGAKGGISVKRILLVEERVNPWMVVASVTPVWFDGGVVSILVQQ